MAKSAEGILMQAERIDPKKLGIDFNDNPIGIGESRVYRGKNNGKDVVLKVFAFGLPDHFIVKISWKQLQQYQNLTQSMVEGVGKMTTLFDDRDKLTWNLVPMDGIGIVTYGKKDVPGSISQYVEGESLGQNRDFRQFILTKGIVSKQPTLSKDPVSWLLDNVTQELRVMAGGERAIRMEKVNIKAQKREYGYHMVITDLSADVSRLSLQGQSL